ncbi:tetraacyldisaccharide 4'-kinase [Croceitalea marina]|uniref:Tetraacyldisaccharide 4'-kinase n=1 Tax=Croceitalea marina TaxID=1775166 RepID=A0ABW5MSE6_9FLAO
MRLLRKIAFPVSLVYAMVVYLRNFFYDKGWFKSISFQVPTVCVGNLSVGGTGKTPMIEYILRLFEEHHKVAVLSRGYRRKTKGFLLADEQSTVLELGDEPFQIHSKFNMVTVAVDEDRQNGIVTLVRKINPDLILLDDAFQHRKVKATLSILLTTFSNLYVNDWYLPTGELRDGKKEARRAQIIIVTKCPSSITEEKKQSIVNAIKPRDYQQVLFSTLKYNEFLVGSNNRILLSSLQGKRFSLVTGIANPQPLLDYLITVNSTFEHFQFADHHSFSENDIESFSKNGCIVTTEKDFTKLKGRCKNLFYLEVRHEFLGKGNESIEKAIKNIMSEFRSSS